MPYVRAGGGAVAYEVSGSGPPVLLIPGVPCRAHHMARLAAELDDSCRVIRVDLPGFGSSSPTRVASKEAFAGRILEAMAKLRLDDVTVVGHSMGAVVAAEVALQGAGRVGALGLLACIGSRPHDSLRRSQIPFQALAERFDGDDREQALDEAEAHFRRIHFRGMARGECEQAIRFIHQLDFAAVPQVLHQLEVPTMMAFADDDQSIEPEIRQVLQHWAPPGLVLRWPTGGHSVHVTRAREIAEGMLAWRAGLLQGAAAS